MPMFSVILPTFNRARYVEEALLSVFQQTINDYEILVVDDGSTDETKTILEKHLPRIHYVHQANQGRSGARNTGLKLSRGKWIAFLDSDDRWFPDKLERQLRYLEENPDVAMVHGHVEVIGEKGESLPAMTAGHQKLWERANSRPTSYEKWALECRCLLSTVVIRRSCFDNIGNFDWRLKANEELDLYLRIAAAYNVGFIRGNPLSYYRVHPQNSGNENLSVGNIQVAKKHIAILNDPPFGVRAPLARRNFRLSISRNYFQIQDKKKARKHFLKAAAQDPRSLFLWPYFRLFAGSFFPKKWRRIINPSAQTVWGALAWKKML